MTAVGTVVGRVVGTTLAAGMSGAVTGEAETAGPGDDVVAGAAAGRWGAADGTHGEGRDGERDEPPGSHDENTPSGLT